MLASAAVRSRSRFFSFWTASATSIRSSDWDSSLKFRGAIPQRKRYGPPS